MMYEIQSETVKHLFRTRFGVQVVDRSLDVQDEGFTDIPHDQEG